MEETLLISEDSLVYKIGLITKTFNSCPLNKKSFNAKQVFFENFVEAINRFLQ